MKYRTLLKDVSRLKNSAIIIQQMKLTKRKALIDLIGRGVLAGTGILISQFAVAYLGDGTIGLSDLVLLNLILLGLVIYSLVYLYSTELQIKKDVMDTILNMRFNRQ